MTQLSFWATFTSWGRLICAAAKSNYPPRAVGIRVPHYPIGNSRAPHGGGRPSPPHRDWVRGNAAPISRMTAATRLGRQSGNARTRRSPAGPNSSPSRAEDPAAPNTVASPQPPRDSRPGTPSSHPSGNNSRRRFPSGSPRVYG